MDIQSIRSALSSASAGDAGKLASIIESLQAAIVTMVVSDAKNKKADELFEVLSLNIIAAEKARDMDAIDKALVLMRQFTFPQKGSSLSSAINQKKINEFVGFDLLYLLVSNRLAEFHSQLELLSSDVIADPNVDFVIKLEQFLMEGSFNLVLDKENLSPCPMYAWLLSQFEHTIRDEIANSIEVAYKTISVKKACKLLRLQSIEQLNLYINEHEKSNWVVSNTGKAGGDVAITFVKEAPLVGKDRIPSEKLIRENLNYATELEKIV